VKRTGAAGGTDRTHLFSTYLMVHWAKTSVFPAIKVLLSKEEKRGSKYRKRNMGRGARKSLVR